MELYIKELKDLHKECVKMIRGDLPSRFYIIWEAYPHEKLNICKRGAQWYIKPPEADGTTTLTGYHPTIKSLLQDTFSASRPSFKVYMYFDGMLIETIDQLKQILCQNT